MSDIEFEKDLNMALSHADNQDFNKAVKQILSVLSKDPENKQALRVARTVFHQVMSKQNINKLQADLIDDPLLNPIFAQCYACESFWVPDPWYDYAARVTISNPAGGKCPHCGKIFCRRCFKVIESSIHCPECGMKLEPVLEPNGRRQQSPSARAGHPSPDVLLIIVDLVPEDDVERFVNGLVRYMNITLKPETKVIIKQFAGARNLENVIAYTVGCTYPLRQELGWEFETNDTVFRDFSSQSTSKTIGGHVAFLYRKPVNDAELLNNEGVALYKLGKLEEAISCYDKALMANPVLAQAWCNKGLALYEIGRIEESVICLDKALEIKPEYKEAWHYKGLALLKIGKQQEAISCFDEALHIDPKDATAWFNRGSALFDLGRLNDSISCYERALEIDPKLLQAWNDKGLCLHKLGRSKEAITCYDNALNLDHRFAVAWCNKGDALAVLGRIHDAIEAYESFILYAPTQCVSYIQQVKDIIGRLKR